MRTYNRYTNLEQERRNEAVTCELKVYYQYEYEQLAKYHNNLSWNEVYSLQAINSK